MAARSHQAISQATSIRAPCPEELKGSAAGAVQKLRLAMILNGVDITGWPGGTIAAVHSDEDLQHTVDAFRESLKMMRAEGAL